MNDHRKKNQTLGLKLLLLSSSPCHFQVMLQDAAFFPIHFSPLKANSYSMKSNNIQCTGNFNDFLSLEDALDFFLRQYYK